MGWDGNVDCLQPACPARLLAAQSLGDQALQCLFTLLRRCPASILPPTPPPPPPGPRYLCPSVHFWDLGDFLLFPQSLTFSFPFPQTHVCSRHGARCHLSAKCPPAPSKGPAVMGLSAVSAEASPFPSAACRRVSAVGATVSFLPLNRKRGGRS